MTDKVEKENVELPETDSKLETNPEPSEPVQETETEVETKEEPEVTPEVEVTEEEVTEEEVTTDEGRELGQYVMSFSEFIAERKIERAMEGLSEGAKAALVAGVGEGLEAIAGLSQEQADAFLATEAVEQLEELDKDAIGNFIRTAVQANIRNIVKTVGASKRQEDKESDLKRSLEKVRTAK